MPLVRVQLSAQLDPAQQKALMTNLSQAVAKALGKPESYMMVLVEPGQAMLMGGDDAPAALAEVRSVGSISGDQARALAATISSQLAEAGVDQNRTYCNFTGVPGAMWGMGSNTFG